ncbi:MAG: helix-turn-helix domain-containing protein [Planctomycetota bacterium]
MTGSNHDEILGVEEAAALLGVSAKTFNKVLHSEDVPARKIGREWKFSRRALIDWVGSGRSTEYYSGGRAIAANGVSDGLPEGGPGTNGEH